MQRTPEPELMDSPAQARAYAEADFAEPHERFVDLCEEHLMIADGGEGLMVLDLGCGPGDITARFARRFPGCRIHGIDAGPNMLSLGRERMKKEGLQARVELFQLYLPADRFPREHYDLVISNSLLHHLADPMVLWQSIRQGAIPGTRVLIMDLFRPDTGQQARDMMEEYTKGEPEVLRQDFLHSLHASWRPEEVMQQLAEAGLDHCLEVKVVTDRHMIITGCLSER